MESLVAKLVQVQSSLKAPKNQRNNFGNYNYRSCEDILEAVKPLLAEQGLFQYISDKVVFHSELRCYVESTVSVTDGKDTISVSASAREAAARKGMDDSQLTGSTSSYARKYALNGMYAIDDTKDSDSTNTHGNTQKKAPTKPTKGQEWCAEMIGYLHSNDAESLLDKWEKTDNDFISANWNNINSADRSKMKDMIAKERKNNE